MTDAARPMKTPPLPGGPVPPQSSGPPSGVTPTIPVPGMVAQAPSVVIVPSAPSPKPAAGVPFSPPQAGGASTDLTKVCALCGSRYPQDFRVCPRDATPLESTEEGADPLVGKVLGETYEIAKLVGEGGMGKVYEARHLRLKDRRFAVKVLHPEFARQPEVVARFQREAESASSITHPNVVDVFDVHKTQDGVPYLVGEFLEGEELGDYIKRVGKLGVPMAVSVARQVCRALAAAHARGIVHRDMKPENVFLVERDGVPVVKVLDFGISKAGSGKTHLTKTGMIMGTPSYMAPEQARGENVDLRADVYSIGALLYHALTGQRPFDSDDPAVTLNMVLTEEPPRPHVLSAEVPEALELVVQRAMSKDPRERYQTTAELDFALAPFDTGGAPATPLLVPAASASGSPSGVMAASRVSSASLAMPAAGTSSLEATARTMMAGIGGAPPSAELATTAVRRARPTIVLVGSGIGLWLVGGSVDALAGIVRYLHGIELTMTEAMLLFFGILFIIATPAVILVMRVRRFVWPNSVRAMELASDLRRTAAAALVTYGTLALLVRALFTVVLRDSASLAEGLLDAGLFAASALGALIAGGLGPLARALRRKANG
jgi:serine/threonine protein kinase